MNTVVGAVAHGARAEHQFEVRRTAYVLGLAVLSAALVAVEVTASGWAWLLAFAAFVPGIFCGMRMLHRRFVLTATELIVDGRRSIRFDEIVGIRSRFAFSAKNDGSITIYSQRRRIVVPGRMEPSSRLLYRELVQRVAAAGRARHALAVDESSWAAYPDAPQEVRALVVDARPRQVEQDAYLFRTRARTDGRGARALPAVVFSCLLAAIGAHTVSVNAIAVSIPAGIVGVGALLALLIRRWAPERLDWLCLHASGIAMVGSDITGELRWGEIESIGFLRPHGLPLSVSDGGGAVVLYVTTADGTRVPIMDTYDCPLPVIAQWAEVLRKCSAPEQPARHGHDPAAEQLLAAAAEP